MNLISHTFLALAAAVIAAGPVLSCCAAGHLDTTEISATDSGAMPPCHGTPEPQPAGDCPGCASCATAAAGPDLVIAAAVVLADSDFDQIDTPVSSVAGVSFGTPPAATGPPLARPFVHATPITLKQRLLI